MITESITNYIKTWKKRCYFDDIPDEVSDKLQSSGRVPSYKAIAIALLKNDIALKTIGFDGKYTKYYKELKTNIESINKPKQLKMWAK